MWKANIDIQLLTKKKIYPNNVIDDNLIYILKNKIIKNKNLLNKINTLKLKDKKNIDNLILLLKISIKNKKELKKINNTLCDYEEDILLLNKFNV